jgi:DUF3102 family protein
MELTMKYQLPATPVNLNTLGAAVRAGLAAAAHAASNAIAHALDIGDALAKAKKLAGHGNWAHWLEAECGLSARSAEVYVRLAAHREVIENQIRSDAANLTIRGALRLIGSARTQRKRAPKSSLSVAAWKAASEADRMDFVDNIPLVEWLAVIPNSWRAAIVDRVDGLRTHAMTSTSTSAVH